MVTGTLPPAEGITMTTKPCKSCGTPHNVLSLYNGEGASAPGEE